MVLNELMWGSTAAASVGYAVLSLGGVAEQVVPPERVKLDYLLDMGLVNVEKSSRLPWSTIPAGCRPLRQAPWFVQVAVCHCRPGTRGATRSSMR